MNARIGTALKALCALALLSALALTGAPPARAVEAFTITHYGVDVTVRENNTYLIEETIEVDFSSQRHGIYRDIPLRFGNNRTAVTGVSVEGFPVSVRRNPTYIRLQIGDAAVYVTGNQVYRISYTLNLGRDQAEGFDTVYLNLIGAYWDTVVEAADFTIRMPMPYEPEDVSLIRGYEGEGSSVNLIWQTEGDLITGRITQPLQPFQGVTFILDLPEGSFTGDSNAYDPIRWIVSLLAALTVGGGLALWLLLGRDKTMAPVVEFRPPDGLSPAQVGFIIDDKVDNEDLSAMFIYWASHGHMVIDETEPGKTRLSVRSDLDNAHDHSERAPFDRLWSLGDGQNVDTDDLTNKYYTTVNTFRAKVAERFLTGKKERLYDPKSQAASVAVVLMGYLSFWTLCFLWAWMQLESVMGGIMLATFILLPYVLFARGWYWVQRRWRRSTARVRGFATGAMVLVTLLALFVINALTHEILTPFERNTLLAASLGAVFLRPFIRRKTPWGHSVTERVLGFRQFLLDAERDRIELLMKDNPDYFYDVLPFAITLGVTRVWADKFEGLLSAPPEWYRTTSTHTFSTAHMVGSLTRTVGSVQSAAVSMPSSSGSGGGGSHFSGGGGSVGGGGGGGGGGSW